MLKVLTGMEEANAAQALKMFSGGRRSIKRMYSSLGCNKLQVQGVVPFGRVVLSYYVFKNCGNCSCKRKLKTNAVL